MKHIITIILISSITTGLFAQSKSTSRVSPWDSLSFKNEISLDVSPPISSLLGRDIGGGESVGITYRLFFDKQNAFRASYRSIFSFYPNRNERIEYLGYSLIAPNRLDSIILITQTVDKSERSSWHTVRAGYEHRFGKRRLKFVLGMDVITGIEKWIRYYNNYEYETTLPLDTTGTWWSSSIFDHSPFPKFYNTEQVLSFVLGFTPIFGLNINLTKRWSLNGSIIFDMFGYFPFKYDNTTNKNIRIKSFYGYAEAPFTDLSVTYHFGR